MKVALISTVLNEAADIEEFLFSIECQTRKPDLVVVVDGGSTDKTLAALARRQTNPDWRVVFRPGFNRSRGRNDAILEAISALGDKDIAVACTNVCRLDSRWLERIVAPIESGEAEVVGGAYRIETYGFWERTAALATQYPPEVAEERKFVTALSMAFTAQAWRDVGGFPEDLDTSEDTRFVRYLRAAGYYFHYEPRAIVYWRPNTLTLRGAYRTYRKFAVTDRKARIQTAQYAATAAAYAVPLLLTAAGFPIVGLYAIMLWLVYRGRHAGIAGLPYIVAVDLARIRGWFW